MERIRYAYLLLLLLAWSEALTLGLAWDQPRWKLIVAALLVAGFHLGVGLLAAKIVAHQRDSMKALRRDLQSLRQKLDQVETRLTQEQQTRSKQQQTQSKQLQRRSKQLQEEIRAVKRTSEKTLGQLSREREHRISALTKRDTPETLPPRVALMMTVPRSGSTWFMDLLRCHPNLDLEPSARLYPLLALTGGRYPRGMCDGPDATQDVEYVAGVGVRVPSFTLPTELAPVPAAPACAVEKLHPAFNGFRTDTFLERAESLESVHGLRVQLIYVFRDPIAVLRSFLSYKRRDPSWMRTLPEEAVVPHLRRTYESILDLARKRTGLIYDYQDVLRDPATAVSRAWHAIWPETPQAQFTPLAKAAAAATRRQSRVRRSHSGFLGAVQGGTSLAEEEWEALLAQHDSELKDMEEMYRDLVSLGNARS